MVSDTLRYLRVGASNKLISNQLASLRAKTKPVLHDVSRDKFFSRVTSALSNLSLMEREEKRREERREERRREERKEQGRMGERQFLNTNIEKRV